MKPLPHVYTARVSSGTEGTAWSPSQEYLNFVQLHRRTSTGHHLNAIHHSEEAAKHHSQQHGEKK
jgi:hypothetical protein